MPDSVLMPAPVRTTHGRRSLHQLGEALDAHVIVELPDGRLHVLDRRPRPLRGHRRAGDRAQRVATSSGSRSRASSTCASTRAAIRRCATAGIEALVLESHCRYVVPARFDDLLHVHTRCVDVRGARFRYEYAIVRDDGTLMAEGYTAHACVDAATFAADARPGLAPRRYCVG